MLFVCFPLDGPPITYIGWFLSPDSIVTSNDDLPPPQPSLLLCSVDLINAAAGACSSWVIWLFYLYFILMQENGSAWTKGK